MARVIAVRVGDHGARDRVPRIDEKIPGRAEQAVRRFDQHVGFVPAHEYPELQSPLVLGDFMQADLWSMAFVFVLATFVGFQVIQNVSRLLHTPLMSLTNAISAIAVVGSIIIAGEQRTTFSTILGTIAVAASMTNIVSGFLITDRMLKMFRERGRK